MRRLASLSLFVALLIPAASVDAQTCRTTAMNHWENAGTGGPTPGCPALDNTLSDPSVNMGFGTGVLAMNDATYPWLILVPRVPGAVELIDLDDEQQAQLIDEIAMLSRVLKDTTRCDKLNVAAIGNVVAQLHVHVVARRRDDLAWPCLVWGYVSVRFYGMPEIERFIDSIRREVAFG